MKYERILRRIREDNELFDDTPRAKKLERVLTKCKAKLQSQWTKAFNAQLNALNERAYNRGTL
jgi:hypothetical protein